MANRFQLWGQAGWASAEVVGETHYAKAIRALFGSTFDPQGTDITVPVQLIPDRNNRHDRNAVGVWSGSHLLGHLPRPEAARYVQVLTSLTTRGFVPEVNARIHGREWGEYDGRPPAFVGTIRLDLAEPHMLVPANSPPPQEHRVLPTGSAVQVNGQQQFLEALRPLLRPEGECWAYVTLHEMADHLVEVRVGDTRVGDLSPKMSGELLPALRHLAEQGLVTAARAIVKGNDGKAEVMLYMARAHDLPESLQGTAARQAAAAAVSPAGPRAASLAGAAPSGRAPASFPASGAATTGPAATGTAAGSAAPGPAGAPAAPGWAAPNEPVPSWAAPSEPAPSWAPAGVPTPAWAAGDSASAPTAPAWAAADDSAPAWAAADDSAPAWAAAGEPAGAPGWAGSSGGVPSWAVAASSTGLPTLPSTGALPGGSTPRLDPPGATAGSGTLLDAPTTGAIRHIESNGAVGNSWLDRAGAVGGTTTRLEPSSGAPAGSVAVTEPVAPVAMPPNSPSPFADSPAAPSPTDPAARASLSDPAARASLGDPAARASLSDPAARSLLSDPAARASLGDPDARASLGDPASRSLLGDSAAQPVSPGALDGTDATIAETTVIPALAAVVRGNAGRHSGAAQVSPAADGNPHGPIPPAPTGIRFAVPPGWPVPPTGWYPPAGWRPDPSWPLAPANWQWWVPTWD